MYIKIINCIVQFTLWKLNNCDRDLYESNQKDTAYTHLTNLDLWNLKNDNQNYLKDIDVAIKNMTRIHHINKAYQEVRGDDLPFFDQRYSYTGNWTGETSQGLMNKFDHNKGFLTLRFISTTMNESYKQLLKKFIENIVFIN